MIYFKKRQLLFVVLFSLSISAQRAIEIKPTKFISTAIPEPSDICYNANSDTFFVVSDDGILFETDQDGKIIRNVVENDADFEAVFSDETNVYAVNERHRKVEVFNSVSLQKIKTITVPFGGGRNRGYEALTFNKSKNSFILVVEKDPITLFELDAHFAITNQIDLSKIARDIAATLTTYALPVITTPITLRQCDDDIDGISTFNLTQKNDFISANYINEIFTYYTNLLAAENEDATFEITNPIAHTASTSTVFARVENTNGCYRVARINLIVAVSQIPPNFVIPNQYLCDDFLDSTNNDRDGISGPFNFSSIQSSLAAILPANVTIKFYKNEADFLAETDIDGNSLEITNITNYRNIGYPNTQKIWVRVDSTIDNSCFGFKTFDVVVESLPFANNVNSLNIIRHCDDDQDGIYGFDTTGIENTILNGQTGVNFRYIRANGTQTNTLPNPLFITTSEIITVRVSNNATQTTTGACFDEVQIQFIVDDLPEAFALNSNLTTACDDEDNPLDQDGFVEFETTGFLNTIISTQTGMNVYYYDENNILIPNSIPNELPNPFRTGTQNVRVVVENPINKDCTDEVILPFIVNPTPKIDLQEQVLICLPETQTLLDAGILDGTPTSDYEFQWFLEGNPLPGENNPTLTVSSEGNYSVEVTNVFNCSKTRNIEVVGSEIASLLEIIIKDLSSEPNTVLINVTGSGDYEYALDDITGPYRDSNFFSNVPMGLHNVYIKDVNGCGILGPLPISVLGIPQYFTPNNDGYNDTWNVKGVSQDFNYRSTIYIFDRYGKLLKQIGTIGSGWDGTYNGQPMPADDYWYSIFFEDGRSAKGHFALKR